MTDSKHEQSKKELEQKLSQLHDQGVVKEIAEKRIIDLEIIEQSIPDMRKDESINKMLKLFKALANKNRLMILWLLMKGVRCACEIEHLLKLSQSTVSHHINSLVEVGAIDAVKSGKWNLVELNEKAFTKEFFLSLLDTVIE
ncbi:MAG: winged helix-turn-helix transcriptional regulator [Candidatus Heimdallarchaeota archaeon]|nr:winged helix-turn-helix transcriptional regulator [Candidatus Heimdallarchaeota archaeon]